MISKKALAAIAILMSSYAVNAQTSKLEQLKSKLTAKKTTNTKSNVTTSTTTSTNSSTTTSNNTNLSSSQISGGLKEALQIGVKEATSNLAKPDGFLKNAAVKIIMPPEYQSVTKTLRSAGLGSLVDKAEVSMNRAAEGAAAKAAPIFLKSITSMSITDAAGVLTGGNNAATNYLKKTTSPELSAAFSPIIKSSLDSAGTAKAWTELVTAYNKIPFVTKKQNPDLTSYVTEKAMDGIFLMVGEQEQKIRTNPVAQTSDLLKSVFGK